jgi:hypothetical protein
VTTSEQVERAQQQIQSRGAKARRWWGLRPQCREANSRSPGRCRAPSEDCHDSSEAPIGGVVYQSTCPGHIEYRRSGGEHRRVDAVRVIIYVNEPTWDAWKWGCPSPLRGMRCRGANGMARLSASRPGDRARNPAGGEVSCIIGNRTWTFARHQREYRDPFWWWRTR